MEKSPLHTAASILFLNFLKPLAFHYILQQLNIITFCLPKPPTTMPYKAGQALLRNLLQHLTARVISLILAISSSTMRNTILSPFCRT